jgi:hypothetical protein
MNNKFFKGSALALLAAAVLLGGNALAQSQPAQDASKPAKSKSKSKKAAKSGAPSTGGKVKFIRGSEETPAQRSARLTRECKGGVNAGACAGYTN